MDYEKAASYWTEKDKTSVKMDPDALKAAIEAFLAKHNTCALATAAGGFVRCTPIEYSYRDGCFWLFSEGGLKFRALKDNKKVCLAVYEEYTGFGKISGLQVSGTAELVEPFSAEYNAAALAKKIPLEALKKLPQPMNLIKITPEVMDFLSSDLKKSGVDSRQQLVLQQA